MANQNELAGAVLLEAFWATRKRDMLDLVAPFVQYAVAKNTCVGQVVDVNRITDIIWAFIVVSILSIIDTLRSKGFFINRWIEKRANAYETKIRDKKIEEYEKI